MTPLRENYHVTLQIETNNKQHEKIVCINLKPLNTFPDKNYSSFLRHALQLPSLNVYVIEGISQLLDFVVLLYCVLHHKGLDLMQFRQLKRQKVIFSSNEKI